jgi:phosphonate transport system substrate-binding protein
VTLGETNGFFGEVIEAGFHEASIEMFRKGTVDGAAIDSFGPSTIQPVAVSKRLDADVRAEIVDVLLNAHRTMPEILDLGMVEKFVPVGSADYDDICHMLTACETAEFLEIR